MKTEKKYKILLLTNRDSDNCGDQVIEACDISLLRVVMKNLGIENYEISSKAASLRIKEYIKTQRPELLETARVAVSKADLIVFGGAPLLNYSYQIFYERTAVTLELAEEYHVPVIFSAVGVERYDEDDPRCQRIKKAVNLNCVKLFTTRDHFELLEKFKEREDLRIGKVSDPAVFSAQVFAPFAKKTENCAKKKIGIFVLRASGFTDNEVAVTAKDAANFWIDLAKELTHRGYEYEFLTSGHFGDEAMVDSMIRNNGVRDSRCVFNVNTPETLVKQIASFDAVITCRLHPSIIAFSLKIPAVGLIWNPKVNGFYDSIGYGDRALPMAELTPEKLADKVEQVMEEGVVQNEEYLSSVYKMLFYGIRDSLGMENCGEEPYNYGEILKQIPVFEGTSTAEKQRKLKRKFRRTYDAYNSVKKELSKSRKNVHNLQADLVVMRRKMKKTDQSLRASLEREQKLEEQVASLEKELQSIPLYQTYKKIKKKMKKS